MKSSPPQANGLPRLMRPVAPGALPGPNLLAIYDPSQNLLIYNRVLFGYLTPEDQRWVLKTYRTSLTVDLHSLAHSPFLTINHLYN